MKKMLHFFLIMIGLLGANNLMSHASKQSKTVHVVVNELQLLFSPGNGVGIDYKSYAYLTDHLARKGNLVVSVQHTLPSDISGQTADEFTVTRSPNCET